MVARHAGDVAVAAEDPVEGERAAELARAVETSTAGLRDLVDARGAELAATLDERGRAAAETVQARVESLVQSLDSGSRAASELLGATGRSMLAELGQRVSDLAKLVEGSTAGLRDLVETRGTELAATIDERGRVAEGYLADLTVLAEDPVETDADALLELPVRLTVTDGEVVHRDGV